MSGLTKKRISDLEIERQASATIAKATGGK